MNSIMLGPPGAGKGTIAQFLQKEYGFKQLSTGDLLREEVANKTQLGQKIKPTMEKGLLVSDELVAEIVAQNISKYAKSGVVLDGFPRNLNQARLLGDILSKNKMKIDLVLEVKADDQTIIRRLSGRRQCEKCKKIYGINILPKKDGICNDCSGKLAQRLDDRPEVIKQRIAIYKADEKPLLEFYRKKSLIEAISAAEDVEEVYAEVRKIIDKYL